MKSEIFLYVVMLCLIDYAQGQQPPTYGSPYQMSYGPNPNRKIRQYDQTGQVQPPTYGSPYQMSYGPNPNRKIRQYDQTGQVQPPTYGAAPYQMGYDPNPYQTNNIPPGQR
jgi:hypothetical protein